MKLRWTRPALRDLTALHTHIAEDDPIAALNVARQLRSQTQALTTHPLVGRPGRVDGTRELVVAGLPYVVAYLVGAESVDVLAVRHTAREWPEELG